MVWNILLSVFIALFGAIAAYLPSINPKLIDFRFNGLKKIKPRSWWTFTCVFITLMLIVIQNILNQQEITEKENTAKKEQAYRDSIQHKDLQENSRQTIIAITKSQSEALARYGYKYDSAQKLLVKIVRDSSKIKVIEQPSPVLELCPDGISVKFNSYDKCIVRLALCSVDASATDFNIDSYFILLDSIGNYHYIGNPRILNPNHTIAKGAGKFSETPIKLANDLYNFDKFIVYITGTYRNLDKSKRFVINDIYGYDISDKEILGAAANEKRSEIINYLKKVKAIN